MFFLFVFGAIVCRLILAHGVVRFPVGFGQQVLFVHSIMLRNGSRDDWLLLASIWSLGVADVLPVIVFIVRNNYTGLGYGRLLLVEFLVVVARGVGLFLV